MLDLNATVMMQPISDWLNTHCSIPPSGMTARK